MEKIVQFIHVLSMFGIFYVILFKKCWFDKYFLILNFITAISWTLFKGECVTSIIFKKMKDPNYVIGKNVRSEDLTSLFGEKYKSYMGHVATLIMMIQGFNVYLVLIRNNLPGWYTFIYVIYLLGLYITNNTIFQCIFFFLFLMILINIYNKLWR